MERAQLTECYNWVSNRSAVNEQVVIPFRFAAALAVTYNLDQIAADGILGLGAAKYVLVCLPGRMKSP